MKILPHPLQLQEVKESNSDFSICDETYAHNPFYPHSYNHLISEKYSENPNSEFELGPLRTFGMNIRDFLGILNRNNENIDQILEIIVKNFV